MDSFLTPLVDELVELEKGVDAFDVRTRKLFKLHAYLLLVFGDMPAVAKLMCMKGHNGFSPCRTCRIIGTRDTSNPNSPYYTPLHRNESEGSSYNTRNLPLCTHEGFIRQATQVQQAPTDADENQRAIDFGIKKVPILARLSSISFPNSFPHDFMHLVFENIIPTLVDLWTGDFKDLKQDTGTESYLLDKNVWNAIGEACATSGDTIPSAFGCHVPNVAKNPSHLIAES